MVTRPVFGFAEGDRSDPHAIRLTISRADAVRWEDTELRSIRPNGRWTNVTDLETNRPAQVRSAPCGLGCVCAAEIRFTDTHRED